MVPRSAVFTGAGISGDRPASLPRGFGLRDDVLRTMHEAATECLGPLVSDDQLEEMLGSGYKLEVVLGRLWGTVGSDALDCVFALRLRIPNEAHMLSALHLIRGGMHVTVNFDVGIELAHDLITGRAGLPPDAPRAYHDVLPAWRALAPADPPSLLTVSRHAEFAAWLGAGRPAALLKVHGGLDREQTGLADVVVVDIEELSQLTAERATAVTGLAGADKLLITGYSGGDPDVYSPLLTAAAQTSSRWCCLSLPTGSSVPADAPSHRIELMLGDPDGLAVTALRELLGRPGLPAWPDTPLPGDGFAELFAQWKGKIRAAHPPDLIARSWAWLVADLGDLDAAEAMLSNLPDITPGARLRHAEILYTRARDDDRDRAARMFRDVAATASDAATRLHCMLRLGDVARGRAVRHAGNVRVMGDLAVAYARPCQVLLVTRDGRQPEAAGDAYRALQQTSLRLLEQLAVMVPAAGRPVLGVLCRAAATLGRRAVRHARNGNRLALIRQHRALLLSLAALLGGRPAPDDLRADMESLRSTYRNADDLPGAANCAVTLAVLALADGDPPTARRRLREALDGYAAGRPGGHPLPSGEALVGVMSRLIDRYDRTPS